MISIKNLSKVQLVAVVIGLSVLVASFLVKIPLANPLHGKKGKAIAQIQNLRSALAVYMSEHKGLSDFENGAANDRNNLRLVQLLTGSSDESSDIKNPKRRAFLEVDGRELSKNGTLIDPWGRAYHIYLDVTGSGKLKVGSSLISESIAIWSDGPNGINEYGNGDDIQSWR